MRRAYLKGLFRSILLAEATMGGMPCGGCPDVTPHTQVVGPVPASQLYPADPADAGFMVDDAGYAQVDAAVSLPRESCEEPCADAFTTGCRLEPSGDGGTLLSCDIPAHPQLCGGGRRTLGVSLGEVTPSSVVADYLATCAALEAASVRSFRRLRHELAALGAPRSLLRACSRAARDEARHTRALTSLARREGGHVSASREAPLAARSVEALATENAVEGCVYETFGALLASWQAEHARDVNLRGPLGRLAADETRHAALAWTLGRWLESRLPPAARRRVQAARTAARARLLEVIGDGVPAELHARGLLPDAAAARGLAQRLGEALPA